MKDVRLIYVTAKDNAEAGRIGRTLVEEGLVACVNILADATSFYRWRGKIEENAEAILIAKTRASLVPKIIERVKSPTHQEASTVLLRSQGASEGQVRWRRNGAQTDGSPLNFRCGVPR